VSTPPEVWLRGPVERYAAELQPVVHSLLQAAEDVESAISDLTPEQIWTRPGGAASIGFHVKHLGGALDRLFTYARDERLTPEQRTWLTNEREPGALPADAPTLVAALRVTIDRALAQLRATPPGELSATRGVGRAGLPTTVRGLLFHAAEHSTRHAGQIITTAKIVKGLALQSRRSD
jgi:uncharacterized damage-inducible protein DinB